MVLWCWEGPSSQASAVCHGNLTLAHPYCNAQKLAELNRQLMLPVVTDSAQIPAPIWWIINLGIQYKTCSSNLKSSWMVLCIHIFSSTSQPLQVTEVAGGWNHPKISCDWSQPHSWSAISLAQLIFSFGKGSARILLPSADIISSHNSWRVRIRATNISHPPFTGSPVSSDLSYSLTDTSWMSLCFPASHS